MFQILIKCKIGNINVILGEKSGRNFHSIWEEAMRGNWEHLTLLSLHYFARAEKEGQRRVFPFKKKISAFLKRNKLEKSWQNLKSKENWEHLTRFNNSSWGKLSKKKRGRGTEMQKAFFVNLFLNFAALICKSGTNTDLLLKHANLPKMLLHSQLYCVFLWTT